MGKSKKIFKVFVAAFLGVVLIFGIVLGSVTLVKRNGSVMKYKGVYLKEGVANYISASYKNDFIKALRSEKIPVVDEDSFWQSVAYSGKTYGDLLKEGTEAHLMRVIIGAYLFDRNSSYTKSDKSIVNRAIDEVLDFKADGSEERFNEIGADMGFDFEDFKKAAVLLYKYEMAESLIFGNEGETLSGGSFSAECNDYFKSNYSKVYVMLVRTDGVWEYDDDTKGKVFRGYSEVEKERVLESIADIRAKINDGRMNEDAFLWHIKNDYPTDTPNDTDGYYFSSGSAYTAQFIDEGREDGADKIVEYALTMKVGEYRECELTYGTAFIYKSELADDEYSKSSLSRFFEDFYKCAKTYVYLNSVEVFFEDVVKMKKYDYDYVLTQPHNNLLGVSFG